MATVTRKDACVKAVHTQCGWLRLYISKHLLMSKNLVITVLLKFLNGSPNIRRVLHVALIVWF